MSFNRMQAIVILKMDALWRVVSHRTKWRRSNSFSWSNCSFSNFRLLLADFFDFSRSISKSEYQVFSSLSNLFFRCFLTSLADDDDDDDDDDANDDLLFFTCCSLQEEIEQYSSMKLSGMAKQCSTKKNSSHHTPADHKSPLWQRVENVFLWCVSERKHFAYREEKLQTKLVVSEMPVVHLNSSKRQHS